ncbi:MAG: hypothetical protein OCU18_03860 [Candidatus Syntrophoarchaeum sp.]|nr:hypothetical protein [Candidatus Syntrophoarchaeum sp.]
MTVFTCEGCGRQTNSACSEYNQNDPPTSCHAAFVDGKWVKGCGFEKADDFSKAFAMSLITGKPAESFLSGELKQGEKT